MSVVPHTEDAFETLIVSELTSASEPWLSGDPRRYDAELGVYPEDVAGFVAETQPRKWQRLVALAGTEEQARAGLVKRLAQQLDRNGAVHVLRRGLSDRGVNLSLCQLKPAHSLDESTQAAYEANRLRVVRQVRFDPRRSDSVDLVLFVNVSRPPPRS